MEVNENQDETVQLRIPAVLLGKFDSAWKADHLDSRSAAIRYLIREYLANHALMQEPASDQS